MHNVPKLKCEPRELTPSCIGHVIKPAWPTGCCQFCMSQRRRRPLKPATVEVPIEDLPQEAAAAVQRKIYQTRRATFVFGAFLGLLFAVALTAYMLDGVKTELDKIISMDSVNGMFEEWKDAIPQKWLLLLDFDDNKELHGLADLFSVGRRMLRMYNLTSKHNVVMVPGVISTGLELWGLSEDGDCPSQGHFRKRMWGSFYMLRTMVLDKTCWLRHIMLDPETGLDPPNIKVRALQGFEAADFFVTGYWIWNKILQNLAVIGYGPDNMFSASYDWRLAYLDLERRDGYFLKLKAQIETAKTLNGQKLYLVGHLMGLQVALYFMKWVEAEGPLYGNGGPRWCHNHLAGFINISGSMLGTPKAIPAIILGEMKDTVQLNQLAVYGLDKFFSKKERVDMLRTFGGVPSMLPKGGELIWGNHTHAPDDPRHEPEPAMDGKTMAHPRDATFGSFIRYSAKKDAVGIASGSALTIPNSIEYLLKLAPLWFSKRVVEQYSFGVANTAKELQENGKHHRKWLNPLEVALPNAPEMKIYCFYGVGNPTERAYTYTSGDDGTPIVIDTDSEHPVYFGEGDGTISLMSHTMCHEWQKPGLRFNPANIETKVVEIKHEPDRFDIRGGAKTAEHVDILGSAELNELVLRVVAGDGAAINNTYVSELHDIVADMDI